MVSKASIGKTTLSAQAYKALRSSILNQRLQAGSKLVVRVLAEDLGLSPTPIKSALSTLEQEGLVLYIPHQGYLVPQFDVGDVEEIYALREVIEGLAARLAAQRADNKRFLKRLEQNLDKQQACSAIQLDRYGDLDLAFHQTLWKASKNSRLLAVASAFQHQVRLFINPIARVAGRLSASKEEHASTFEAIVAQDAERAEAIMRSHIHQAGLALRSHLQGSNSRSDRLNRSEI